MSGGGSSELRVLAEQVAKIKMELEALKRRLAALERGETAEASKKKKGA